MLKAGETAPDFTLPDREGRLVSLHDFKGKRTIVYFYPKDNTPGCTRQAAAFRDAWEGFCALDVAVIGISRDGAKSHQGFAEKHQLPFLLLSDPERAAIESYGVWQKKKLYGKESFGVVRTSFVIGPDQKIQAVFEKVKPDRNASEILAFLQETAGCG